MPKNHFDLSGKIAVITGGSRGLGREMVLAFADAGADVVITSRKIDPVKPWQRKSKRQQAAPRCRSPVTSATGSSATR